ncbi:hypothetical protein CDD81_1475 [Ophiocordyceps australis]|uniref:Uncharacterized protein n=1 Tax=Ophiocordyceps australis TaxID=1399860 RepID=A0A2C5XKI7_9HYPO|nr:hypothetical protein CDD81_1475 [Ophiocordyceps australis]
MATVSPSHAVHLDNEAANSKAKLRPRYQFAGSDLNLLRQWTIEDAGEADPIPADEIGPCIPAIYYPGEENPPCCEPVRYVRYAQRTRDWNMKISAVESFMEGTCYPSCRINQCFHINARRVLQFPFSMHCSLETQDKPPCPPVGFLIFNDFPVVTRWNLSRYRPFGVNSNALTIFHIWLLKLPKAESEKILILCALLAMAQWLDDQDDPKRHPDNIVTTRLLISRADDKENMYLYQADIQLKFLINFDDAFYIRTLDHISWPRVTCRKIPYEPHHAFPVRFLAEILPKDHPLRCPKALERKRKRATEIDEVRDGEGRKQDVETQQKDKVVRKGPRRQTAHTKSTIKTRQSTKARQDDRSEESPVKRRSARLMGKKARLE